MRVAARQNASSLAQTETLSAPRWQEACKAFGLVLLEVAAAAAMMMTNSSAESAKVVGNPTTTPTHIKHGHDHGHHHHHHGLSGKRAEVMLRAQAPLEAATLVDTPMLVQPGRFLEVNTSGLAADSALSQALLGDLPKETKALAKMMLASDASGPLVIALQKAVKDGVSGADRHEAIRTALAKILPFSAVRDVLSTVASPRVRQLLAGLERLGDQNAYGSSLRAAIIAVALDPQVSSWTAPQRDQAVITAASQRGAYMSLFQHFYTEQGLAADASAVTDEQCSVAGAAAFRLGAAIEDLQGCHRVVSFVDGSKPIELVVPRPLVAQNLLVEDVARGLALLPADVRQHIDRVVLNPKDNPDDAMWRAQPGFSPAHRSSMTASVESGTITIYPSQNQARGLLRARGLSVPMLHEVGHLLHPKVLANDAWNAAWNAATAGDDARASGYAFSSAQEDFAETFAVYISTRGTDAHDAYRLLMPQRFAVLDQALSSLLALPVVEPKVTVEAPNVS